MKSILHFVAPIIVAGWLVPLQIGDAAIILPPLFIRGDQGVKLAAGDQTAPEIAAGGNVTLAVWQDERALPGSLLFPSFEWETSSDIYGVRIDANGRLVDRVPIP